MLRLNSHVYYIIGLHINDIKSFYDYIISIKHIYNKQELIRIKRNEFKPLKMYNFYKKITKMALMCPINDEDISEMIVDDIYYFTVSEILGKDYEYIDEKNTFSLKINKQYDEYPNHKEYLNKLMFNFKSDKHIIGCLILENEKIFTKDFKYNHMFYYEHNILGHDTNFRIKKWLKITDLNNKKFYLNYKIVLNCSRLYKKSIINGKILDVIHVPIRIKRYVFNTFSNMLHYLHNKAIYYEILNDTIYRKLNSFNDIYDLLFLINFFEIKICRNF
jgi:hypothetical protein